MKTIKAELNSHLRSVVVVELRFHAKNGKELLVTCPAELNMCPMNDHSQRESIKYERYEVLDAAVLYKVTACEDPC